MEYKHSNEQMSGDYHRDQSPEVTRKMKMNGAWHLPSLEHLDTHIYNITYGTNQIKLRRERVDCGFDN